MSFVVTRAEMRTVLLVTTVGAFMAPFDGSVVNIAIPAIAYSIKIGMESVVWIPLAYLLFLTVLLVNVGRLADLTGRKRLYILGFAIFTAASALCGASSTGLQLVIFRAVQGAGAAFILANSPAIVTDSFPSHERGKALGINTMAVYAGLTTGPVIGGVLVQAFGWRSIFYANVPIGIMVIGLASLKLKDVQVKAPRQGFDVAGAGALSTALASLLIALTLGPLLNWASTPILALLLLSTAAFLIFLYVESRSARYPTFDLSLFSKNRLFAAANTTALLSYIAVAGVSLVISVYLQDVQVMEPRTAGLFLFPMFTCMALLAPICGWLSDRLGSRLLSSMGMFVVTLGLLLFTRLNAASSPQDIILQLALIGVGFGLFSTPNTSAVMGSVERDKLGVAAGTVGTMRFMGQSIGLALVAATLATALPTGTLLQLLVGLAHTNVTTDNFITGMRNFFLIASSIGGLATLTSLVRGRESG